MSDWKSRLQEEHKEVNDRTRKLVRFLELLENSNSMDMHDWNSLCVQRDIMISYVGVLDSRMIKLGVEPIAEEI